MPCSRACASVSPTEPISGSVNVTRGTAWYSAGDTGWPRMSATTMLAWYMDMWVNSPCPVTSPMAHTPGAARRWSSTGMVRPDSSTPSTPTPSPARSVRRPVATSTASAVTCAPASPDRVTVNRPPSCRTAAAVAPVRTSMPSRAKTSPEQLARLRLLGRDQVPGCPPARSPGHRTGRTPGSAPPRPARRRCTSSDPGTSVVSMASRLVQYGVPARPVNRRHERLGAGVEQDAAAGPQHLVAHGDLAPGR